MMQRETRPEFATAPARRPVVICVDDDPAVLRSLRRVLQNERYDLVATSDPDEALGRVLRRPVDVVIADQQMPGMAGTDLLRVVERKSPKTRRVILSGFPDPKPGGALVQHFIPKPWNDDLLRAILRRMTGDARRETEARVASAAFMVQIPILAECGGRRGAQILPRILRVFRRARAERRGIVALLEGLRDLKDDPGALLADLELGATTSGVTLHVVDGSGLAGRYRRLRGSPSPLMPVHGPDPARPAEPLLLVDRSPARRVFLKLLLQGLGHAVRTAGSAAEARTALEEEEKIGRILVDLTEPHEMMEWIEELTGRAAPVPVVPLLPAGRGWDPVVYARWGLLPPLVRPYGIELFTGLEIR